MHRQPFQENRVVVEKPVSLCSAGGETIKNINQQSGAHVELQRNPPLNTDPNVRIFSIRGTPQQMEVARQLIDEKIGVGTKHSTDFSLFWDFAMLYRVSQNFLTTFKI